jgi:hypothetical protein
MASAATLLTLVRLEPSYKFKIKLYEQINAGKDFYEYVFDDFYRFKVSSVL